MLIITWNFPYLSKMSYTKPIYYEDLVDDEKKIKKKIIKNMEVSKKFKNRFIIFQQLILSVTLAILVEYFIKFHHNKYTIYELFGLIGGMFSLYVKITRFVGKLILNWLYQLKTQEKNKLLQKINFKNSNQINIIV